MGSYILCQVPRAKTPFYVENISTNIYTIEELCFYLHHNIYLLDETILNEALCFWLRDELGLKKLYQKLYPLLEQRQTVGEFILPIFKEINFLTHSEFKEMNERLQKLEEQPLLMRQKLKGDYLTRNGKYVNAIRIYQQTLADESGEKLGEQFAGQVYNNMGCAYMHLFQTAEALECFKRADARLKSEPVKQNRSLAAQLEKGEVKAGEAELYQDGAGAEFAEALAAYEAGQKDALNTLLQRWVNDYHRQTGY